jgi:hypothetical protein
MERDFFYAPRRTAPTGTPCARATRRSCRTCATRATSPTCSTSSAASWPWGTRSWARRPCRHRQRARVGALGARPRGRRGAVARIRRASTRARAGTPGCAPRCDAPGVRARAGDYLLEVERPAAHHARRTVAGARRDGGAPDGAAPRRPREWRGRVDGDGGAGAQRRAAAAARVGGGQPPAGGLPLGGTARLRVGAEHERAGDHGVRPLLLRAAGSPRRGDRRAVQRRRAARRLHGGRDEPTAGGRRDHRRARSASHRLPASGILGPKVLVVNELAGSGATTSRGCSGSSAPARSWARARGAAW